VDDPYAALDRLAEQGQATPVVQPPVMNGPEPVPQAQPEPTHSQRREERLRSHSGGMETKLLLDVTALRNEIRASAETKFDLAAVVPPAPSTPEMAPIAPDWDIVEPEMESVPVMSWSKQALADLDGKFARTEPMLSINAGACPSADASETLQREAAPQRRYARLFTRLRERRAATEQETTSWPLRLWR
jgi:hypothetical protein